ncbi:hypothetical protein QBC38DRAFT_390795 [Podospora fimiseda]|uniref:Protein transport protein BOS1 n=1 Tax=Podospora fimiseda TaxID=252190 RepID=A0AAN7BQH5_9PEZI|nr:hypothetical protein QBC38DRAFT_390795 [Podospora fimiseda]
MNTTFNSALKQSTTIRKELATLSHPSYSDPASSQSDSPVLSQLTPAALGSLSASLTAFARTIDEYNSLAKQELNKSKQEKALERIRDFRTELHNFREQLEKLKSAREEAAHAQNRAELLGRRTFAASTPENPYANATATASSSGSYGVSARGHARTTSSAEAGRFSGGSAMGSGDVDRESHALREQAFFSNTHSALDDYIARGQAVLGDLNQQREILKNTQRRLYSVGNTLGISGDTIRMIERRAKQDKWIFWGCVLAFFLFCWLVLHFLR